MGADRSATLPGKIRFSVPGKPQGKARARTVYNLATKRTTSYTPQETVLYENLIKTCYRQVTDSIFDHGEALEVGIVANFEPVKSTPKKQRQLMLDGSIYPTKKPDIDNIIKVVLDALNGVAYKDDTQVIDVMATKRYAEKAGLEVTIYYPA